MMPKSPRNIKKKKATFSSSLEMLGLAFMSGESGHGVARMMHKVKLYLALKSKLEI